MTTTASAGLRRATPWHLWLVGVLSLLWNAFGAYDYTMSHARGDAYYREMGMGAAQIARFHAMPAWMELFWFIGVWGAVLGSILLLLKSRWAVPVLAASLLGAVVSLIYGLLAGGGAGPDVIPFVIAGIAAFLAWYAWAMRRRGVLR